MTAKKSAFFILASGLLMAFPACNFFDKKLFSSKQSLKRTPANTGEFCNWGFAGPKYFRCRGKTYVFGSPACTVSGFHKDIFCEERFSASGLACKSDNSADTIACYQRFTR